MDLENKRYFMAVDPGKKGGICILNEDKEIVEMHTMPVIGKEYDIQAIRDIFLSRDIFHAVIENVHAIQGKVGNSSNFNFGLGKGILMGLVAGLDIPYTLVNPKAWQKEVWEGVTRQTDNKKTSLLAAKRLFPSETFLATSRSRVPHDGIVDATLMAEYARRKFNIR